MELKGEMSMLNILRLQEIDVIKIQESLQKKWDEAPQFFAQSAVIVDCSEIIDQCAEMDYSGLKEVISKIGFVPVAIRGIPENLNATMSKAGWAIMRAGTATPSVSTETVTSDKAQKPAQPQQQSAFQETSANTNTEASNIQSVTIDRPVRSGQQVYAANADMTVLSATSSGSELMADGSIHAYGPMRGRVLAGARGNESARIFCKSLQAELIAIAGRYQLLDESDTNLKGKPAMIRLEGEKLIIEPLGS